MNYDKYIIWSNYGSEGWRAENTESFDEAVKIREDKMSMGCSEVIITEYVPLKIQDGRTWR